jgi:hypothetical protein
MERINLKNKSILNPPVQKILYPQEQFDLRSHLVRLLILKGFIKEILPLEELHLHVPKQLQAIDKYDLNQLTYAFYEMDNAFRQTYFGLIKYIAQEILKFDFIFQTTPTVRFHPPQRFADNFRAENDELLMYHSDTMLGHCLEEINCWLPLTNCYGTNALQLSPLEDSLEVLECFCEDINFDPDIYHQNGRQLFYRKLLKDFDFRKRVVKSCVPVTMTFGEVILFDTRCIHATAENREKHTRISMDFRLIPVSAYEKMTRVYRSFGKSGRMFVKGDVFFKDSALELTL